MPSMYGTSDILAPMVIEKVEEVSNRACQFVFVPWNKVELGCQVSFDKTSFQSAYILRHSFVFVDWTEEE